MHCCNHDEPDDRQRRLLLQGLAAGLLGALLPAEKLLAADLTAPQPLPATQSIYRLSGRAWVNGKPVDANTRIGPNDTVKTAHDSELVFVVGGHAMLLRGGSHLVMKSAPDSTADNPLIDLLRLLSGKLLSVSRRKGMQVVTPAATVGIRGTGIYLEAGPEKTYFCTCYGETDVVATGDPSSKDSIHALHHDKPVYIFNQAQPGLGIRNANDPEFAKPGRKPNHTDAELIMIEALVGRTPAFAPQEGQPATPLA